MKKLIVTLGLVLLTSTSFAAETVQIDSNPFSDVFLTKGTLVQESKNVRSIWVQYKYTKDGSIDLKQKFELKQYPKSSKVKYAFNCSSQAHKIVQATIFNNKDFVITTISNGPVEDVIPGSVGEAIRNFICDYDIENDRPNAI